ncbi:MAG: hypothetical protein Mars2KO_18540 [Maribacter sp.]
MKQVYKKAIWVWSFILLLFATPVMGQLNLPSGSQVATVSQRVGISDIKVTYSRPSVNGREIWGALVPYGMNNLGFGTAEESPWRAGANENTIIEFSSDVKIEGKDLAAGTYGLHMVIKEDGGATIIFSKNHTAWGSYFYEPSEDALKVDVTTKEVAHTEQLTFSINDVTATTATVALNWEKKQIPFTVEVDVPTIVLNDIRQKLQNSPGFNRQTWEQAANYALNNDGDLNEALGWINGTIEGQFYSQKNFNNLSIKAGILTKQGKTAEANAVMDEALGMATVFQTHAYGRQLIAQNDKERAMKIFKLNAKNHKGQWPVDFGLARAHAAMGNYKTALKHLKIAAGRAPDQPNKDAIAGYLVQLEKGEDIN